MTPYRRSITVPTRWAVQSSVPDPCSVGLFSTTLRIPSGCVASSLAGLPQGGTARATPTFSANSAGRLSASSILPARGAFCCVVQSFCHACALQKYYWSYKIWSSCYMEISITLMGTIMHTSHPTIRRHRHTPEFKRQLVALCQAGVPTSAVVLAQDVNAEQATTAPEHGHPAPPRPQSTGSR